MPKPQKQIGALPVRQGSSGFDVMLITSRETGRWIIPKGWPHQNLPQRAVAAREAYEEAGLRGKVGKQPIGSYRYEKRLPPDRSVTCQVTVFLLEVKKELDDWPEKQDRQRGWFSPDDAMRRVNEPELGGLLASVADRFRASKKGLARSAKIRPARSRPAKAD